jgi:hypothetical protein
MRPPIRIAQTAATLIGVAAAVAGCGSTTDDGSVTVPVSTSTPAHLVRDHGKTPTRAHSHGATVRVKLRYGGKIYSCPLGTGDKLHPYRVRMGELELQLRKVRAQARAIARRYGHTLPAGPWARWTRLLHRDHRLVHAYNVQVHEHNAIIDSVCTG